MIARPLTAALALLLATACGPAPLRLAVPAIPAGDRIASAYPTIELLDVSLPDYAQDDAIFVQGEGGALTPLGGAVWADDPARALTLDLARALAETTGAIVAPEPWPFEEDPAARLDLRLSEAVADAARGEFVLRGQYFVAPAEGAGRPRAASFRVAVPLPAEAGPATIAAARGQATLALARRIAEDGLR